MYKYEQYKISSRGTKENSRVEQGGLKEKDPERSTSNSLRYCCATLINKKSTTVQASGSEHVGSGESESCLTSGKMSVRWHTQTSTCV